MIPALNEIPRAERRRLVRAVERREWHITVWSIGVVIGAYVVFGLCAWLAWDLLMTPGAVAWMRQKWPAAWMRVAVGFGSVFVIVPIVAASFVARTVRRRLIRRAVERELAGKVCLWCGYDMRGTAAVDERVRCPECGKESPVGEGRPG